MNDAAIVLAFICCEAAFQQIEHLFTHWRVGLRAAHHGAFVAWVFHPSISTGLSEWCIHMIARLFGH